MRINKLIKSLMVMPLGIAILLPQHTNAIEKDTLTPSRKAVLNAYFESIQENSPSETDLENLYLGLKYSHGTKEQETMKDSAAPISHSVVPATTSIYNYDPDFTGEWEATLTLKNGETITRTPDYIRIGNGMRIGKEVHINSRIFNGMALNNQGLHLKVDSTPEEFLNALVNAGVLDLNHNMN